MEVPKKSLAVFESENGQKMYIRRDGYVGCISRTGKKLSLHGRHKNYLNRVGNLSHRDSDEYYRSQITQAAFFGAEELNKICSGKWKRVK